jgi:hypothetical protein
MSQNAFEALQASVWTSRVRLAPSAVSSSGSNRTCHDDVWLPVPGERETVRLSNISTGHFVDLRAADVLAVLDERPAAAGLRFIRVVVPRILQLQGARARWSGRTRRRLFR